MSEEFTGNQPNEEDDLIASIIAKNNQGAGEVYGDQDDEFVHSLRQLTESFDVHSQSVLYPGSSKHAGVARVFGQDKVTHVDVDENAMEVMASKGYTSVTGRLEDYAPDQKFDLIVSYNAGTLSPDELDRLLRPGGYVVANNWHGSANALSTYGNFRLVGGVLPSIYEGSLREADEAAAGLGTTRIGVTREGGIAHGDDIDENTMTVMEDENSPDGLFLFQKNS